MAALRTAPPTIIAIVATVIVYIQCGLDIVWKYFLALKVFLQCDAASHDSGELDVVHDICTGIGCEVFFDCILTIHPIPATRPVIVAASSIDFTSLLSDIVLCIFKILKLFL